MATGLLINAVLRAVSSGLHLREMLKKKTKSNLTLSSLKTILKGQYKEQSTADISHKLVNISQENQGVCIDLPVLYHGAESEVTVDVK